jgi:FixJ family two-component response regulator
MLSIIDDDESVRAATQCLLRSLGYVTHTFASAEEFLLSPYVSETSCVIADVHMPKMSGLELQSRLRAKGHRTPIIFITAFPEEKLRARALQGGAVCFLRQAFRWPSPDRLRRLTDLELIKREIAKQKRHIPIRCSVPMYDGTESVAIDKDGTWARFFMEAPARRRRCVERYNIVKRA